MPSKYQSLYKDRQIDLTLTKEIGSWMLCGMSLGKSSTGGGTSESPTYPSAPTHSSGYPSYTYPTYPTR
ncbi:hypothetical protein GCM10010174_75910 [Kutzneria viridogrisea]|uniref:Uncharacterized protein n=1 Tax=Kutzneria viridogrisea TaxID=47990 RepID=A0ABR6BNA3_9PSEU|nr:hypothetical protein [Kutzneria viridogrisea]